MSWANRLLNGFHFLIRLLECVSTYFVIKRDIVNSVSFDAQCIRIPRGGESLMRGGLGAMAANLLYILLLYRIWYGFTYTRDRVYVGRHIVYIYALRFFSLVFYRPRALYHSSIDTILQRGTPVLKIKNKNNFFVGTKKKTQKIKIVTKRK